MLSAILLHLNSCGGSELGASAGGSGSAADIPCRDRQTIFALRAPPFTLQQSLDSDSGGVRLCSGSIDTAVDLERGLMTIKTILESVESMSIV
jgi:hypothetical protein